jgi:hypothetical protein
MDNTFGALAWNSRSSKLAEVSNMVCPRESRSRRVQQREAGR